MFNYRVDFDEPWYLLLLGLLPLVWWFGRRSLTGLGRLRRWSVVAMRTLVVTLIVLALAEVQLVQTSNKLTVIYLLDQTLSIPVAQRQAMIEYVNPRSANIAPRTIGPASLSSAATLPSRCRRSTTMSACPKKSKAHQSRTHQSGGRHAVGRSLVSRGCRQTRRGRSDGNQNLGDALEQARGSIEAGISIDVQPVRDSARAR